MEYIQRKCSGEKSGGDDISWPMGPGRRLTLNAQREGKKGLDGVGSAGYISFYICPADCVTPRRGDVYVYFTRIGLPRFFLALLTIALEKRCGNGARAREPALCHNLPQGCR